MGAEDGARPARSYLTGGPVPRRLVVGGERLAAMAGTRLLVGVTVRAADGALVERRQFHGTVAEVSGGVVVLRCDDGDVLLPAEPDAYEPARRGTYRLANGEVVVDPDWLGTWVVTPPRDDHALS